MPQNNFQSVSTKAQWGNKEIRSCALGLLRAQLVVRATTARSELHRRASLKHFIDRSSAQRQMAVEAVAPRKAKGDTYKCAKICMSLCAGHVMMFWVDGNPLRIRSKR